MGRKPPRSHRQRSAGRPDPSGSQKTFWLLLVLAAIAGIGITIACNPGPFRQLLDLV